MNAYAILPNLALIRRERNGLTMIMLRRLGRAAATLALACCSIPSIGAEMTVEQAIGAVSLDGPRARGVKPSPDGRFVAYLKADPERENVSDLWIADSRGGKPFRLLAGASLDQSGQPLSGDAFERRERLRISATGVTEYMWDEGGHQILIPAGDTIWIVDVEARKLRKLPEPGGEYVDVRFSPSGTKLSFVRGRNLYVTDVASPKARPLTTDGGGAVSWGLAEFVAQEEMRRSSGYWWSPDDRFIAAQRVDESAVDLVPRIVTTPTGSSIVTQRYPRAGRTNASVSLAIINASSAQMVEAEVEIGSEHYLARADWARDGKTLYVQRQSRDQRRLDLFAVDPLSGAARLLRTATSDHWVELSDDFRPLASGEFLWTLERDGNRHIYRFDASGRELAQVTSGDWPVSAIEAVDEAKRVVYFSASRETPLERHLYTVSYSAPEEPRRLTGGAGWWRSTFPKVPRIFVGTYSDPATPPRTALYSANGTLLRWIEANPLDESHPYWPFIAGLPNPQYGTLRAADGQRLHYSIQMPTSFDPARRYPAIISTYGGPMVQTVRRQWGDITDRLLLDRGYVLFRLDNRGSANRSVAFKSATSGKLGIEETRDQLVGAAYLAGLPYVDPERIGVMGWSFGGFMTLMLLTEPNHPFAAGAAGASPTDWRLYDTHYAERFLGLPAARPEAYDEVDIVKRISRLKGRLLLIQGMADDNVVFDHAIRLSAALQRQGTVFEQLYYPGGAHLLSGSAKRHLWHSYLDFFDRTLKDPK